MNRLTLMTLCFIVALFTSQISFAEPTHMGVEPMNWFH